MRTSYLLGAGLVVAAVSAVGCAGQNSGPAASDAAKVGAAGSAGCRVRSIARPLGEPRNGSTVALATVGSRKVAFVADEDAHAVIALDVDAKKELGTTPLAGAPSQLMVTRDGRIVVLLRDKSQLQVLEAEDANGTLASRCTVDTAEEPVALAASPDDSAIFVTSAWGKNLRAYDAARMARLYDVPLAREPRAVVISDDGKTAFVAHAVGSTISAVDLKARSVKPISIRGAEIEQIMSLRTMRRQIEKLAAAKTTTPAMIDAMKQNLKMNEQRSRFSCQGFALAKSVEPNGRVLAPQVFVDPGDPERRPEGYGDNNTETEVPSVAVIDEGTAAPFDSSLAVSRDFQVFGRKEARDHQEECLLPRAAAVDPRTHSLYVTCFGIDTVIAYDSASASPQQSMRRRWVVGSGPSGIAIDPTAPRAIVWSQFDRTVSVLDTGGADVVAEDDAHLPKPGKIALAPITNGYKVSTDYALGRMIFHAGGDARISKDGRACASCHPDGRDDSLTWATPEGPRRSIMLAGRITSTAPYSWNGTAKSLPEHVTTTFDRLDGSGLRSLELDALITYISSLKVPNAHAAEGGDHAAKVARGAQIFASKESQCSTCHESGKNFTDGLVHDVGSKAKADRGNAFNTPSLHLIGGTGPYFHDGRYKNLHDLLTDSDGKMGKTGHLNPQDLEALEAYLVTL